VVLSGRNGSLISPASISSLGPQSSPLAISVAGDGNDIFLRWRAYCKGQGDTAKLDYSFPEGVSVDDETHVDLCRALFDADQVTEFVSWQKNVINGSNDVVYTSEYWAEMEDKDVPNGTALAQVYLASHPNIRDALKEDDEQYQSRPYARPELFDDSLPAWEEEMADLMNEAGVRTRARGSAYVEGGSAAALVAGQQGAAAVRPKRPRQGEEMVPEYLAYPSGPHRIEKNQPELEEGDAFEDPYPGRRKRKRRKRQTAQQKAKAKPRPGIAKMTSTGTLAPSLKKPFTGDTIDVIVSTHWVPSINVPVFTAEREACLERKLNGGGEMIRASCDLESYLFRLGR